MNTKKLLKFYYSADKLNAALDRRIDRYAYSSDVYRGCEYYAEKICRVIEEKRCLAAFWEYLDRAMRVFCEEDGERLKKYATMRRGITCESAEEKKSYRRVLVRFTRKVGRGLARFERAEKLVGAYYCLL